MNSAAIPIRARCVAVGAFLFALLACSSSAKPSLNVAVASNFTAAMRVLSDAFEEQSGYTVNVSAASSGKLYAQIANGAPFDLFLSADADRPQRLENSSLAVAGSRFTYAIGRLVLWSSAKELTSRDCLEALRNDAGARIAIANPETAPYGFAARETLQSLGLWERVQPRLVRGENIAQTLHFAASGNARFGFIALSQLSAVGMPESTCIWRVPPSHHAPIEQQAVVLSRAAGNVAASQFLRFLAGDAARAILSDQGYDVPSLERP